MLFDCQIETILAMPSNLPCRSVRLSLLQTTVLLALGAPPVLLLGFEKMQPYRGLWLGNAFNENRNRDSKNMKCFLVGY